MKTITAYELKRLVDAAGHAPHFFDRKSMHHFGDTMKNYGVRQLKIDDRLYYELYRRRPVRFGAKKSAYFDAQTLRRVFLHEDLLLRAA